MHLLYPYKVRCTAASIFIPSLLYTLSTSLPQGVSLDELARVKLTGNFSVRSIGNSSPPPVQLVQQSHSTSGVSPAQSATNTPKPKTPGGSKLLRNAQTSVGIAPVISLSPKKAIPKYDDLNLIHNDKIMRQ